MTARRRFLLGLLIVQLGVTVAYAPTLNDYFAGDDFLVIGPVGRMGAWEVTAKAFVMRDDIPYWRPLVTPLYALYVHGFGLNPMPYHLVVLGLHLTNVTLVAVAARLLLRQSGVALAAGLLFGVHAAHTLTVAQISSTVELFSVVWYLGSVCAALYWLKVRGRPGAGRWYGAAVLCFVLALLSKESTASAAGTLTVLFLLRVYLPGRQAARFVRAVAPFWLLVLPYIAFTYITDTEDPTGITRMLYAPGWHVPTNLWWMVARLAWPVGNGQGPVISAAAHTGAVAVTAAALIVAVRGQAASRFLVAWMVIAMTPLTLWRPDMMLSRFTYQAAAPFAMLCAWGGWLLLRRLPLRQSRAPVGLAALAIVAALLAWLTAGQNRVRTREADSYFLLVHELRRTVPQPPAGSEVVIMDGPWSGPFHALYLEAVAETLYGRDTVRLRNVDSGEPAPAVSAGAVLLRYTGSMLVAGR